jgi:hypothetical protein
MSCFAPCPACNRHVSSDETACPFCSAALPDSFRCQAEARQRLRGRLSRAGLLAAGAVLMSGAEACLGSTHYGTMMPYDAGTTDTSTMDGGPVALYGAAPPAADQAPAETDTTPPAPPAQNKT